MEIIYNKDEADSSSLKIGKPVRWSLEIVDET